MKNGVKDNNSKENNDNINKTNSSFNPVLNKKMFFNTFVSEYNKRTNTINNSNINQSKKLGESHFASLTPRHIQTQFQSQIQLQNQTHNDNNKKSKVDNGYGVQNSNSDNFKNVTFQQHNMKSISFISTQDCIKSTKNNKNFKNLIENSKGISMNNNDKGDDISLVDISVDALIETLEENKLNISIKNDDATLVNETLVYSEDNSSKKEKIDDSVENKISSASKVSIQSYNMNKNTSQNNYNNSFKKENTHNSIKSNFTLANQTDSLSYSISNIASSVKNSSSLVNENNDLDNNTFNSSNNQSNSQNIGNSNVIKQDENAFVKERIKKFIKNKRKHEVNKDKNKKDDNKNEALFTTNSDEIEDHDELYDKFDDNIVNQISKHYQSQIIIKNNLIALNAGITSNYKYSKNDGQKSCLTKNKFKTIIKNKEQLSNFQNNFNSPISSLNVSQTSESFINARFGNKNKEKFNLNNSNSLIEDSNYSKFSNYNKSMGSLGFVNLNKDKFKNLDKSLNVDSNINNHNFSNMNNTNVSTNMFRSVDFNRKSNRLNLDLNSLKFITREVIENKNVFYKDNSSSRECEQDLNIEEILKNIKSNDMDTDTNATFNNKKSAKNDNEDEKQEKGKIINIININNNYKIDKLTINNYHLSDKNVNTSIGEFYNKSSINLKNYKNSKQNQSYNVITNDINKIFNNNESNKNKIKPNKKTQSLISVKLDTDKDKIVSEYKDTTLCNLTLQSSSSCSHSSKSKSKIKNLDSSQTNSSNVNVLSKNSIVIGSKLINKSNEPHIINTTDRSSKGFISFNNLNSKSNMNNFKKTNNSLCFSTTNKNSKNMFIKFGDK